MQFTKRTSEFTREVLFLCCNSLEDKNGRDKAKRNRDTFLDSQESLLRLAEEIRRIFEVNLVVADNCVVVLMSILC